MIDYEKQCADEKQYALGLANRLLDLPYADPDGDLCVLSRQLIRRTEEADKLREALKNSAETMRVWHNMDFMTGSRNKNNAAIGELAQSTWVIYWNNAPEMQAFREIFGDLKS